ncbi:RNA polymerase factor sigma-32 [Piscirickettsia salmonis]|uniref:RNA polymerase sigma factor RpoH n=1 Tax=Piscirickettsia salmonis TaxID=1238 RepID=A0A9Q5VLA8_PISSA|nr:RNA polymerase sigma factor RpoH [Piscirickettsia salmonis]WGZ72466.1 RNA polymerase sigma factor RpoH [Piscirickettsia salmonis EM-90]ALA26414.1 RNA polymerase factor sigma-32 [Piscirickettsia salmonis]APS43839.1 RNA polymerase factor sigma-32 [Piscirickettsia salmonis]APS47193.1 RNA polymerase factor sigma-32 [Piscirickettsia salmonis]APS51366.1 RNA polymerase factor sigma-32 [Piscirickettsia salmonis]
MTQTTLLTNNNKALMLTPGSNLDTFIHNVNQVPMLSAEEELALAQEYHKHQNIEAARRLVMAHLRFVVKIARSYSGYGLAQADLIQEGNIGLMKAVKRFDPSVGVRLVSFAVHWIKAEIHEFIIRNWRIVKVATTKAQRKLFFSLRSQKKRLGWFNQAEVESVAADLGVPAKTVVEMEARLSAHDAVIAPTSPEEGEGTGAAQPSYLEDTNAMNNPALALEHDNWQSNQENKLLQAISILDERSRDILQQRWLNEENKATLHELAAKYQVSAERVRQLEKSALKKLRKSMTE